MGLDQYVCEGVHQRIIEYDFECQMTTMTGLRTASRHPWKQVIFEQHQIGHKAFIPKLIKFSQDRVLAFGSCSAKCSRIPQSDTKMSLKVCRLP